jgi:hypothetical protein
LLLVVVVVVLGLVLLVMLLPRCYRSALLLPVLVLLGAGAPVEWVALVCLLGEGKRRGSQ